MKRKIFKILSIVVVGTFILAGCGSNKMDSSSAGSSPQSKEGAYRNEATEEVAYDDDIAEAGDAKKSDGGSELNQSISYAAEGSDMSNIQSDHVAPQNEKLIYTYHYSVETKQFDEFLQNAMHKAEQLGGYVQESETDGSSVSDENRYARIVLRIPCDKKNEMLSMVQKESNITYSNVTTDNVTLNYVDMQSHIQALRKEQSTLLDLIGKAKKVNDLIALQSQLTEVRYEIESYESQLRTMDNLITYSTIYLEISEVQRTTAVTGSKTSMRDEIKNKFSDNLYAVGQWLQSLLVWFVSSLPILVPLAVIVVLACIFLRKRIMHKKNLLDASENQTASLPQDTANQSNPVHQDTAEQTQQDTAEQTQQDTTE